MDPRSVRLVTLHLRFQARLFRATSITPVRLKPSIKNSIPVIPSGVNEEFKNWKNLMGELRQFHPGLKISQIKDYQKTIS